MFANGVHCYIITIGNIGTGKVRCVHKIKK